MTTLFHKTVYPKDIEESMIIDTAKDELEILLGQNQLLALMGTKTKKGFELKYKIAGKDMIFNFSNNQELKSIINETDNKIMEVF